MFINKDLIRWALLIGAAPIWIPYLRILWRDFNHALRDEGGLIGIPPRGEEAARLRAEKRTDRDRLVSDPILRPEDRQVKKLENRRSPARPGSAPSGRPGTPKAMGFRRKGGR